MRIGLVADTHGFYEYVALKCKEEGLDLILHAGDYARDAEEIAQISGIKTIAVRGNNDPLACNYKDQEILEIDGHRLLLIHGHMEGVQRGTSGLMEKTMKEGAEIAVFGHTHKFLVERGDGIILINPGSPSFTRSFDRLCSFVVLELEEGREPFIERIEVEPF